ncbi:microtubule-associated protein YTM1 [Coprinopsis cinerea okayama7|uniref:Ribosome biogenesis protein YTM1 n=1 Tax=Coprinopsis cinerea (strain Okayama-7 / 130 / ATCC MYA-4618 / FGSC 9003) TaxID=240176 RepID=YTM1_COPC7|nr:microtubule-associated protein YTM1 [Coprinopsis cinerea okayama7\|eukprot:XP_001840505.1 microtubule-associated protein YTM1 [Coprinopsis cinerea okayama7\
MDASTSNQAVVFSTQTPYPLPSQKYMIPTTWRRYHLSQLVNKALGLAKPVPFDFLVKGEILRTTIAEWCAENGVGEEETLEIEYIESVLPPQRLSEFPHESWVSAVSCSLPTHFLTTAYDGHLRAFDLSKNVTLDAALHSAPITSFSVISSTVDTYKLATSSLDLTAQISEITLGEPQSSSSNKVLASLHLHTAPVSSIAANPSGTQLLTSSWDSLIGVWDTTIPPKHEVPEPTITAADQRTKKRRKVDPSSGDSSSPTAIRKAPLTVLKSHIGRVSKVAWLSPTQGVSCGFDSTLRTWDVERGLCTRTISASEKPFLDLAVNVENQTALTVSTDRTMTLYDLRTEEALSAAAGSFLHPATPSCVATTPESSYQVVTGAYDGVVRVWDTRSTKAAISSFKAWDGTKKVLAVDWKRGVIGIGGEGGLDVWKVGLENETQGLSKESQRSA